MNRAIEDDCAVYDYRLPQMILCQPALMRVLHLTPEFPPVIWGGLGTAVGGLATASARAGMSVGVLLVGGALVIGNQPYATGRPVMTKHLFSEQPVFNEDGLMFFHVSPDEAAEVGIRLATEPCHKSATKQKGGSLKAAFKLLKRLVAGTGFEPVTFGL